MRPSDLPGAANAVLDFKGGINKSNNNNNNNNSQKTKTLITEVKWQKVDPLWTVVYYVLVFLSGGLLYIFSFLDPSIRLWLTTVGCQAKDSDFVSAKWDEEASWAPCSHQPLSKAQSVIVVEYRSIRYYASRENGYYLDRCPDIPSNFLKYILPQGNEGYTSTEPSEKRVFEVLYGKNETALPPINAVDIVIRKSLSPFFLFQYFSVIVWMCENYILFGCLIIVITVSAITAESREQLYNLASLHKLAGTHNQVKIILKFLMDGGNVDKQSLKVIQMVDTECFPGDYIMIENGMTIPCDAVLVYGRVVVDESSLTGESVPVTKTPILSSSVTGSVGAALDLSKRQPDDVEIGNKAVLDSDSLCTCDQISLKRSGNVLFAGTKVRALHGDTCIAVVYRTGFRSAKGQLIASLLNPKDAVASFIADASKLVFCMLIFTTIMYLFIVILFIKFKVKREIIFLKYLDAITIAVPPALTACLTVSTAISVSRLQKLDVFVSETSCVNIAGSITAACFDKTGTLTEERLDFQGGCIVQDKGKDQVSAKGGDNNGFVVVEKKNHEIFDGNKDILCHELMASCHNLAILDGEAPNGDPLEVEQLNACKWNITMQNNKMAVYPPSKKDENSKYIVHKHFEFTPERLRAGSVLIRPNKSIVYLLNGSPEMIISLSDRSTIPSNVSEMLIKLAKRGLRVIAMAYREIDLPFATIERYTQDQIESMGKITFYGLLFFSSKLKTATVSTIQSLHSADISVKMITGDHIHTGIAVAMECKIIDSNPKYKNIIVDEDEKSDSFIKIIDAMDDSPIHLSLDELLDYLSLGDGDSKGESDTKAINPLQQQQQQGKIGGGGGNSASKIFNGSHLIQMSVTGKALQAVRTHHSASNFSSLVRYGRVFARTKPLDKKTVVEELKLSKIIDDRREGLVPKSNYRLDSRCGNLKDYLLQRKTHLEERSLVLFCGDGANDMQALRAANVGVSLCAAETSVAAPITSTMQTPGSCIDVLLEGRASLCTAYVLVCFNIMYGVIQLFMCIMMYRFGLIVGDYQYLIQDLFFTLVLGVVISMTPPTKTLSIELPPKRFLHPYLLSKLLVQIIIFMIFQLIALAALQRQPWYTETDAVNDPLTVTFSYEATTINNMALFQLMIASIVSTIGPPFRASWHSNPYHVGVLILQFSWVMFQVFGRPQPGQKDFKAFFEEGGLDLKPMPSSFGAILVVLMFINLLVCCIGSYLTEYVRKITLQHATHDEK